MRRIIYLSMVFVCILAKGGWAEDPVHFADANLKARVEATLGISNPTPTDMLGLTELQSVENSVTSLVGLGYATNLKQLMVRWNPLKDISPIASLKSIEILDLIGNQITDISPIAGLAELRCLDLRENQITEISSVSAAMAHLWYLMLSDNDISDLSSLSGLTGLEILGLVGNPNISDLSPLSELTNLEALYLRGNSVGDVLALSGLGKLKVLWLTDNDIVDISPLSGLTNLYSLFLNDNPITDFSVLSGLTGLSSLGLSGTHISNLSPLSDLKNIINLDLNDNFIDDLSALSELTGLRILRLNNNCLTNISILSSLANLEWLFLNDNRISDISAVAGLPNLRLLYLYRNPLDCLAYNTVIPMIKANNPGIYIRYDSMPDECYNQPPVADVGEDQTVAAGDIVYLNGSESYDPEGDILGFAWFFDTLPVDSLTVLINEDTVESIFVADVEGQYTVSLVVSDGVFGSEPNTVIVTAIPPEDAAEETLIDVNEIIVELPPESLMNENSANALSNKIDAALTMIEEGLYEEALDKLQNDILKKTDGCASEEEASDKNDWIIDCEAQALVYPLVTRAIELLERLIE